METQYNPFYKERVQHAPTLPFLLQGIESLDLEVEDRPPVAEEISSLFPQTRQQPIIHFKKGDKKNWHPLKVGVVLSGGQAPGGHNVIIGLFDALKKLHKESQLVGFLGGASGIVERKYKELTTSQLEPYRNTGGFDMIGSGRTKIESQDQLEAALKNCKEMELDGLVIIGGDDSNTNAAILAEFFKSHGCQTKVIGVPKTIDGDLKHPLVETPFGFDTACKVYSEMIGNICRDALSAKKYTHFIKLMGRSASHIALECALQTHPNHTLIGEEVAAKKMTLKEISNQIALVVAERAKMGKNYGVVLIPEGLIEFVPEMKKLIQEINALLALGVKDIEKRLSVESKDVFRLLPRDIKEQILLDRDPHGNVRVSQIATDQLLIHTIKEALKELPNYKGEFTPVGHFFGYEGRCSYPSHFDANYCYALGFTAAALIINELSGYMSSLQNLSEPVQRWQAAGVPITALMNMEERKGKKQPVIKKALVDLEGEPFKYLVTHRGRWAMEDAYRYPPPIQFFGPPEISQSTTLTLQLEHPAKIASIY